MSLSMLPCLRPFFHVLFHLHVQSTSMFILMFMSIFMFNSTVCCTVHVRAESGTNGITPISVCLLQTENKRLQNFCLFGSNRSEKWKFVFHGQHTINGNRRLLFRLTCPSMYIYNFVKYPTFLLTLRVTSTPSLTSNTHEHIPTYRTLVNPGGVGGMDGYISRCDLGETPNWKIGTLWTLKSVSSSGYFTLTFLEAQLFYCC
jgi:hypothetical protein